MLLKPPHITTIYPLLLSFEARELFLSCFSLFFAPSRQFLSIWFKTSLKRNDIHEYARDSRLYYEAKSLRETLICFPSKSHFYQLWCYNRKSSLVKIHEDVRKHPHFVLSTVLGEVLGEEWTAFEKMMMMRSCLLRHWIIFGLPSTRRPNLNSREVAFSVKVESSA